MPDEMTDTDFDDLVREAGRDVAEARKPWGERRRSTQEDAVLTDSISHSHCLTQPEKSDG